MLPNMVNLLYVDDSIYTLDPMFAPFKEEMEEQVDNDGITWIEDNLGDHTDSLHHRQGGLHCATNTRRKPDGNLLKWWKHLEEEQ